MKVFHKWAVQIGDNLSKYDRTEDEHASIKISYVIEKGLNIGLFLFILTITLLIFEQVGFPIFLLSYISLVWFMPIRIHLGGFHLNDIQCLILSIIVPIISGFLALYTSFQLDLIWNVYLFALLSAYTVGVIDSKINPVSDKNKSRYQKRVIVLLSIMLLIHTGVFYWNIFISNAMFIGLLTSVIQHHIGKIQRKFRG